ncbi:MAG: hypothetical protein Q9219_006442 [cf. Caloplaca sp. 3 TL-2023]
MTDHKPPTSEVIQNGENHTVPKSITHQYDLLPKLIPNLDRHLTFPLLEFLSGVEGDDSAEVAKAKYELLKQTNMTDYVASLWQDINNSDEVPEEFLKKREEVLQRLSLFTEETSQIDELLNDESVVSNLRSDKVANLKFLEQQHGVTIQMVDMLYDFGRFQYSCGSYANAAHLLDQFRILSTDNDKASSASWGKLAADILTTNWEVVMEEVNKVKESIDTKLFNNPLAQLDHRTWLIHWTLFPFFNHEPARDNITDMLFSPSFINTIQTNCPWILRYLAAAVVTNRSRTRNTGAYQKQLKDLVRIVRQEGYEYNDPVTEFIKALYVDFDFEEAQKKLGEAEEVLKGDFFLSAAADAFVEAARHLISESYCKIHQRIDIKDLSARLGLNQDEGEKWIVNLIRDTRMDGKLDYKEGTVLMNHPANSVYQQVIERTKGSFFRTSVLSSQMSEQTPAYTVSTAHTEGDNSKPNLVRIPNFKNENELYSFQFSSVYDGSSTQQSIFDNEIAPTIRHLLNGFDVTIFAYGVTGTGKTHTMRGGKSLADRGIIPRLLSSTYRRCRKIEKDSAGKTSIGITLSYYEIYNDKIFDLLEAPEKRTPAGLSLRENGGKTFIVGLTERPCESLKEFENIYDQANVNRSTSATKLNAYSSRSHAILCFKVTMTTGDETRVSTASAIDLAGSEDNRRTENRKDRLVESASINKSLFVLAKCVEAIGQNQTRIPYRESKMTRILSLGQNDGLTVMILNLAACKSYHLDTISSLNFANRTKKIEVREIENEPIAAGYAKPMPITTGASMQRQPLRPLAIAVHNANVGSKPSSQKGAKPAKTFSVYSDKSRNSGTLNRGNQETTKGSPPLKRLSDAAPPASSHPAKRRSPDRRQISSATMSRAVIEDIIEHKVTDILAARAIDQPMAAPVPAISKEVQRRLELLEQKVDQQDDSREQGLTFLLMAKQHAVRGENKSALRMFLLAKDYFPDNVKLNKKIESLRKNLEQKTAVDEESSKAGANINSCRDTVQYQQTAAEAKSSKYSKTQNSTGTVDDTYVDEGEFSERENESDSFRSQPRLGTTKHKAERKGMRDDACICEAETPRTKRLLSIINSQDIRQFRRLRGVGKKRAEAILEALCGGEDGAEGNPMVISTLAELGRLQGIGMKTAETMRLGLEVI